MARFENALDAVAQPNTRLTKHIRQPSTVSFNALVFSTSTKIRPFVHSICVAFSISSSASYWLLPSNWNLAFSVFIMLTTSMSLMASSFNLFLINEVFIVCECFHEEHIRMQYKSTCVTMLACRTGGGRGRYLFILQIESKFLSSLTKPLCYPLVLRLRVFYSRPGIRLSCNRYRSLEINQFKMTLKRSTPGSLCEQV